jgi:hypothetical protein
MRWYAGSFFPGTKFIMSRRGVFMNLFLSGAWAEEAAGAESTAAQSIGE